jgi:hypothetical protein
MDDIKMDLQDIEWNYMDWSWVADDRYKGWTVMCTVMNNLVGYSAWNYWPAEYILPSQAGLRYVELASERSTCVYCWTVTGIGVSAWNLVLPLTRKNLSMLRILCAWAQYLTCTVVCILCAVVCLQPTVQRFLMPVSIIIVPMHAITACLRRMEL